MAVSLTVHQWREMVRAHKASWEPDWPAAWNIAPGSVVHRNELHATYGGNSRAFASRSSRTPNTFVYIKQGATTEYATAGWVSEDLLIVPGHAQSGDRLHE